MVLETFEGFHRPTNLVFEDFVRELKKIHHWSVSESLTRFSYLQSADLSGCQTRLRTQRRSTCEAARTPRCLSSRIHGLIQFLNRGGSCLNTWTKTLAKKMTKKKWKTLDQNKAPGRALTERTGYLKTNGALVSVKLWAVWHSLQVLLAIRFRLTSHAAGRSSRPPLTTAGQTGGG